jgi:hypothetical protein
MATELAATNLAAVDVGFWLSLGRLVGAVWRGLAGSSRSALE